MSAERSFDPRMWNLFAAAALSVAACGQADGEPTPLDEDSAWAGAEPGTSSGWGEPGTSTGAEEDDYDYEYEYCGETGYDDGYGYDGDCGDGDGDACDECQVGDACAIDESCEPLLEIPECAEESLRTHRTELPVPGPGFFAGLSRTRTPNGGGWMVHRTEHLLFVPDDGTEPQPVAHPAPGGYPHDTRWVDVDGDDIDELVTLREGIVRVWDWGDGTSLVPTAALPLEGVHSQHLIADVRPATDDSPGLLLVQDRPEGTIIRTRLLASIGESFETVAEQENLWSVAIGLPRPDGEEQVWTEDWLSGPYRMVQRHALVESQLVLAEQVPPDLQSYRPRVASLRQGNGLASTLVLRDNHAGTQPQLRVDWMVEPAGDGPWWLGAFYLPGQLRGLERARLGVSDRHLVATDEQLSLLLPDATGGLCRSPIADASPQGVAVGDVNDDGIDEVAYVEDDTLVILELTELQAAP